MTLIVLCFFFVGDFGFEKIGVDYTNDVPLKSFRFIPALCGSMLTPIVYQILCQLGLSPWAGALAGLLVIFGENTFSINSGCFI